MRENFENIGYEIEEEEEFDENYEERLAEIEKNIEKMEKRENRENRRENFTENSKINHRNAFSRELSKPEPFTEDRIVSSDDIETMVIDEGMEPLQSEQIEQLDKSYKDLEFEIIDENEQINEVTEEQFKNALKEEPVERPAIDSMVDSEIEGIKLERDRGINEREHLDSYYQPELVKEWEEMYHSEQQAKEQEEFLSQEALNDLQKSMDEIHKENLGDNLAETITEPLNENLTETLTENIGEDPSKLGFHDQLAKAMDEIMSVDNNDLVSNEQAGENLDIGLDLEMGNTMQDGMSSEFDTEIGEDLDSEEEADMDTTFDMDNSS